MKRPVDENSSCGRMDSPICLIHFSHPFVYIESAAELDLLDSDSDESCAEVRGTEGLLPFERALEGPPRDLLSQILFPDQEVSEARGSLSCVLQMLRDAWTKSRPNSGTMMPAQRHKSSSNRRRLSAPDTRIRRYNLRSSGDPHPTCRSAPASLQARRVMCTDSVCQQSINMSSKCYCHTFTRHDQFSFACNYTTQRFYIEDVPQLVPRYSALPRTLSMLANCSSSASDTSSSHSDDEDNQSLADSLEDVTRTAPRLTFDDKPVRGAPPLMPHRHAPRAPVPRGETFFVPLSERGDNQLLALPPTLRDKLERRRQQLESRPRLNRSVVVAQKSPRPVRSRRMLGTSFQRFECIPEERDTGRGRYPATRTYVPRAPLLSTANRGLQAIMRDPNEVKVGLQDMGSSRPAIQDVQEVSRPALQRVLTSNDNALQRVLPPDENPNNALQRVLPPGEDPNNALQRVLPGGDEIVARGKQAMGEQDLVAVTTGWVNFYMLRGEEERAVEQDAGSARRSRWSSRGKSPRRGASSSVTEVSVSGRSSTVHVQQRARPRALPQRRHTADSVDVTSHQESNLLPQLPASAGERGSSRHQATTFPALTRGPVIRVKHPTNEDSESGSLTLPALPAALAGAVTSSSSDSAARGRSSSSSRSHYVPSANRSRVARQSRHLATKSSPVSDPASAPGTWSVTVSGVCPQPEMEVRLVFPPAPTANTTPAVTAGGGGEVVPASKPGGQQSDSGLGEENTGGGGGGTETGTARFTLSFKNNDATAKQAVATPSSPRRGSPVTSPRRRGSVKALQAAPVTSLVPTESMDAMMWPEMQALLEEQVINIKKHTIARADSTSGALVERLRGGEALQQVQQLSVRGAAITTRRKKRTSS